MKSLKLYQEQIDLLKQQQRAVVEELVQVIFEGSQDGYSYDDLINTPRANPAQPSLGFDL